MGDHAVAVASSGTENIRTRQRTIGATVFDEQYVIPIDEAVYTSSFTSNSFRIPARASAAHPIFTVYNGAAGARLIAIRSILVDIETIVARITINPIVHAYRFTTAATGGTSVTSWATDSNDVNDANLFCLADASADGTNSATALAFTPTGSSLSGRYVPRMHTLAGVTASEGGPADLLRNINTSKLTLLRAGNGIGVRVDAPAALTAGDFHYEVTITGDIYTLP